MEEKSLIRERLINYIKTHYDGSILKASKATGVPQSTIASYVGRQESSPNAVMLYKFKEADPSLDLNKLLSAPTPYENIETENLYTNEKIIEKKLSEIELSVLIKSHYELINTINNAVTQIVKKGSEKQ